jgi:hypothetical protein
LCLLDADGQPAQVEHALEVVPLDARLSEWMSVRRRVGVVLSIRAAEEVQGLRFRCAWRAPLAVGGGPESGERLESQAWQVGADLVSVGTEDAEMLSDRLPRCGFSEELEAVRYLSDGLEVIIPMVHGGEEASLHMVIAENAWPEPHECAAWYAVDVTHRDLTAQMRERA